VLQNSLNCHYKIWRYISPNQWVMKKGDLVRSTGKGKTKSWGNIIGIVVQVEKDRIYVIWSNTFVEDEMTLEEVEPFKISDEVSQLKFSDGKIFTIAYI